MRALSLLTAAALASTALASAASATVLGAGQAAAVPTCAGRQPTLVGTPGPDRLVGTSGADVIAGRGGDDVLSGLGGDDVLCGGAGHDVLRGGAGDDELHVGPVQYDDPLDLVIYDTATRGVRVDLGAGTATGQGHDRIFAKALRLYGSEHDDVLVGAPGRFNVIAGQGGDDRIVGGDRYDRLYGDNARPTKVAGNDTILAGGDGDAIYGGPGRDLLRGGPGPDFFYSWTDRPSGSDRMYGGRGDDSFEDIVGPGDRDAFDGGPGADSLWLRTRFVVDGSVTHPDGRLVLDGAYSTAGDHPATGTTASLGRVILPVGGWRLVGTAADEQLWAPRGVSDPQHRGVTIRGRGGDDTIIGTEYDDVLLGGAGRDQACGRSGDDQIAAELQAEQPIDLCDPR